MTRLRKVMPVKFGGLKSCGCVGIGNPFSRRWVVEAGKTRELISSSGGNRRGEAFFKVAEKKKRTFHAEFFAHEKERGRRRQQQDRDCGPNRAWVCDGGDSFSEGAITNLIVILKKRNECARGKSLGRLATSFAISIRRYVPLKIEAFAQTAP